MRHEPGLKEDAKNLSLITGSGLVAVLLTIGLLANQIRAEPEPETVVRTVQPVVVEVVEIPEIVEVEVEPEPPPVVEVLPLTGAQRLYGTVTTQYGKQFTGFIRWDRNEGSTVDLLDAVKSRRKGGSTISGIRFGHVDRIEVLDRNSARFSLKSGDRVDLDSNASDLGTGLRALLVDEGDGHVAEFQWRDLEAVEFFDPGSAEPSENRMYGTLTTRTGMQFTGYVTWDVDEIYSTDILDGELDGRDMKIAFGDIATIERHSSWGARVTLRNGESMILEDSNDVDSSIRNISVSDPTLGQVLLRWDEFDMVEFHGLEGDEPGVLFDGGTRLYGTVETEDGASYTGELVWDNDEEFTWEMLNGDIDDVEFSVEFGNIQSIEKTRSGARVTLYDGRVFDLSEGNDVDSGNRGIQIRTDGRDYEVEWRDFSTVTFRR
jgi:hypothetical protein